jgi:HNH endonuclease
MTLAIQTRALNAEQIDLIKRTIRDPDTGCMLWQGAKSRGYGVVERAGVNRLVHRLVVNAPRGTVVRHTCDNPGCINPEHLLIGTQSQNVADAVSRGRVARGRRLPQAKLTETDVAAIREEYRALSVTQQDLAERYGVHQVTISRAITGKDWKHVGVNT